jgi:hypothetical protein
MEEESFGENIDIWTVDCLGHFFLFCHNHLATLQQQQQQQQLWDIKLLVFFRSHSAFTLRAGLTDFPILKRRKEPKIKASLWKMGYFSEDRKNKSKSMC